jgi:dihydroflavonol-4-reductase
MALALVTGASGFVGSAVVRACLERGRTVRVLVRRTSPRRHVEGLPVEVVEGDVRDKPAVPPAGGGADEVYHVAALFKYVWRSTQDFYDTNVGGTSNVLEACREAGVRRVVHTSTIACVGSRTDGVPVDETFSWNMGGHGEHYTESKRQAEVLALEHAAAGLPVVVVNPAGPLGPRDGVPTPGGRTILEVCRGRIPVYPKATMCFVDVDDLAAGHVLAAERGRIGERYLLAAHNVTIRQFLETVAAVAGVRPPRIPLPDVVVPVFAALEEARARLTRTDAIASRAIARMRRYTLWFDSGKAVRELGVSFRPLEESIRRAVGWYRAEGYLS